MVHVCNTPGDCPGPSLVRVLFGPRGSRGGGRGRWVRSKTLVNKYSKRRNETKEIQTISESDMND